MIKTINGATPRFGKECYVAETAAVIGDVTLGDNCSVWYSAVVRGDIEYIKTMLPNISADVVEKQKILQPGNCVGFGSAFKLPMIVKLEMPSPAPYSSSCNVSECWRLK